MTKATAPLKRKRRSGVPEILKKPLLAYKFSEECRDECVQRELGRRLAAAYAYFGVQPDVGWAKDQLLWALLQQQFSGGFTVRYKPPGGAPKVGEHEYAALADQFDEHCQSIHGQSDTNKARLFLKAQGGEAHVGREQIKTPKAMLKAVRRGRAERSAERSRTEYQRLSFMAASGWLPAASFTAEVLADNQEVRPKKPALKLVRDC